MYNDFNYGSSAITKKTGCTSNGRKLARTSNDASYLDLILMIIGRLLSFFRSDAFTAGFIGVAAFLVIGIVGGIEFGLLDFYHGGIYSALILSSSSVVIYLNRNND